MTYFGEGCLRFVTVCERGREGGDKNWSKIAWHTLWQRFSTLFSTFWDSRTPWWILSRFADHKLSRAKPGPGRTNLQFTPKNFQTTFFSQLLHKKGKKVQYIHQNFRMTFFSQLHKTINFQMTVFSQLHKTISFFSDLNEGRHSI